MKKWRGIGHTEQECKTKQREKGTGNAGNPQTAKPAKLDFDDSADEGVPVKRLFVRMIKAMNPTQHRPGWYEYDTGAQVHTTNEKDRLINP